MRELQNFRERLAAVAHVPPEIIDTLRKDTGQRFDDGCHAHGLQQLARSLGSRRGDNSRAKPTSARPSGSWRNCR